MKKILSMTMAVAIVLSAIVFNSITSYASEAAPAAEAVEATEGTPAEDIPSEGIPTDGEQETQEVKSVGEDSLDQAKNGVVQINCVYIDGVGTKHLYKGASGILVGTSEKDEYVLTSLSRIVPNEETKNAFLASLGVPAEDIERANLSYEVVIENDMTTEASVLNSSVDLDLAVFKLSQVLYNRTPMKLIYSKKYDQTAYDSIDTAYALGFPDAIEHEINEVYYSNDRVNKIAGQISNVIGNGDSQWIEHKAEVSANNVGGPLISPDGEVIGMNSLKQAGNYYYAVSSNTIVKVLTGMGIEFSSVTFEEKAAEAAKAEKENNKDDKKVVEIHTETPKWVLPVVISLAVVLSLAIAAVIVLLVITNKNKKKEEPVEEIKIANEPQPYQFQPTVPAGFSGEISSDTTVLGAGSVSVNTMSGTNMATPSQQLSGGRLERKSNGESIAISKATFCLGKDDLHCDYCIRDNNTVSRQHANITVVGSTTYIEDNHSKNGTFLNDVMLVAGQPQELRDGDVVRLSNEEFVYKKQ